MEHYPLGTPIISIKASTLDFRKEGCARQPLHNNAHFIPYHGQKWLDRNEGEFF